MALSLPEVRVIERRRNELLKRVEYLLEVANQGGTPGRAELRKLLSTVLDAKEDNLMLVKVLTPAGRNWTRVIARVYDSRDQLMRIEPKYLLIREGFLEKPKKG
jgi:small subunit ribosomal protein S24e